MARLHDHSFALIIPAAGKGTRMGGEIPKIFAMVGDRTVLGRTLSVFSECSFVTRLIIASREDQADLIREICVTHGYEDVVIVPGGEERKDSVENAFNEIGESDYVIIHDAVRPFVSSDEICRTAEAAVECGAAVTGVKVKPTIKKADTENNIVSTPNRDLLWEARTPQIFKTDIFRNALERKGKSTNPLTDDAQLVEQTGYQVRLVQGSYRNIKITTHEDLLLARSFEEELT